MRINSIVSLFRFRVRGEHLGVMLAGLGLATGCPSYVEVASGFELSPERAALDDEGTVVTTSGNSLLVADGDATSTIDLAAHALSVAGVYTPDLGVQIRAPGDIVFMANRESEAGDDCFGYMRGVYHGQSTGGGVSLLYETCHASQYGRGVAMSNNGTIAFSTVVNGSGSIHRGSIGGPITVLQSGSGEFFNNRQIAVNDEGRVMLEMEYLDGFAGGLMRALLAFDEPSQTKLELDSAVEKLGGGTTLPHAINNSGLVAFTLNQDSVMVIDESSYPVEAGVYYASPTLFNTMKDLTPIATKADGFCRFGNVDINDDGQVAFEAALGEGTCPTSMTGIYEGSDPETDAMVERGYTGLGAHQYFDEIRLGELNNAGQVSFTTTYSEPLVEPVKVWRRDP